MMHTVQNDAHTLPGCDERGDTDEPAKERDNAPGSACVAERNEQVGEKASDDGKDAQAASEDDTRSVAVADCPADEVRVRLSAK